MTLSDREYARLAGWLADTAGLASAGPSRRASLAQVVAERLCATGGGSASAYLDLVEHDPAEQQELLDAVTIGETQFFRNGPQTTALRDVILPELIEAAGAARRLRIWSAGCSTGEEAYTVALLLRDRLGDRPDWDVTVLGTDIAARALAAAGRARYGERAVALADAADLARHFQRDGTAWVVRPAVRALVSFQRHNLVTEAPPLPPGGADLVLCRNVTIYFDRETTRALVGRLHTVLRDGGYLLIGHAETLWRVSRDFRLVRVGDAFVHRREPVASQPPARSGVQRELGVMARPSAARHATGPLHLPDPGPRPPAPGPRPPGSEPLPTAERALAAGLALSAEGRWPEALQALRQAIYLDPRQGFAQFLLASALQRAGDGVAAARCFAAAAEVLAALPADLELPEFDGRRPGQLASLCRSLAGTVTERRRA